jgi:hypothetical protein
LKIDEQKKVVQDEENKANDVSQEWDYIKKKKNEVTC